MPYNDDINDPDYSIFNAYYFFIGGDNTRLIILIYIFLCIALNILIYIAIFLSKKKLSFVSKITLSIMGVNLIHTFVYSYEWVFKIENKTILTGDKKDIIVGFLLTGNPNNMGACYSQAFILIASSISQDFLINFFFYLINQSNAPTKLSIWISISIFAFVFPCALALILLLTGSLGINDHFCYVARYYWNKSGKKYETYHGFGFWIALIYLIRTVNLIFSTNLMFKIIKYVKKRNMKITYILKISYILLLQLVTISVGIIYRFSSFFSKKFSSDFSSTFLIINTLDGVLFPLSFIFTNGMHIILYRCITGKKVVSDEDEFKYPNIDSEEDEDENEKVEKSIAMSDLSKKIADIGPIND